MNIPTTGPKTGHSLGSLYRRTSALALLAPLALAAPAAQAQQLQQALIEEMIVTATKREQSIQDIPVAVSAFSGELLKNSGITDARQLVGLAPSFFLSSSASEAAGATARIRGIGTTGDNAGLESAVAIFIDGVYRNRSNVGLTELGEVERIEVLRGPQGTLFGRNASAGLVNVITKQPEFELGGYGEATYGNFDQLRFAAGITGPIVEDVLAARIDAVYFERDGFLDDAATGGEFNNRDRFLLRGQFLLEPTDAIDVRIIADYADREEDCCASVTIVRGATAGFIEALGGQLGSGGGGLASDDPFDRESATTPGRGFQQDVEEWGISAELNWDFELATLTSISAYRDYDFARSQDIDFTSADILFRDDDGFIQGFETFTQELRLQGNAGPVDWLVGFFYADEDLPLRDAILVGANYEGYADFLVDAGDNNMVDGSFPGFAAVGSLITGTPFAPGTFLAEGTGVLLDRFDQESKSWALFTHNNITVTDDIEITLGLRYSNDSKDLNASVASNNAACNTIVAGVAASAIPASLLTLPCLPFFNPLLDGTYDAERDEDRISGTAKISYRANDDLLFYASYARGYKDGGFNLDRAGLPNPLLEDGDGDTIPAAFDPDDPFQLDGSQLEFQEETVDAFELGMKGQFLDRRLTANVTLFYQLFDDFQLNTFDGISFIVENLSGVTSRGFELEYTYLPNIEGLILQGGVTFSDTEYDDDLAGLDGAPLPDVLSALPGQQITNAAQWTMTAAATYEKAIPNTGLLGILHLDLRYSSDLNTGSDLDVEKIQEDFTVVNGRVGIGDIDGVWRLELFARNLFNKDYIQIAFDAPLQGSGTGPGSTQTFNAFLAEPRTWGITLRGQF